MVIKMIDPIRYDKLTGLPDRTHLWSLLQDTLVRIRRNGQHAGALLIDLDNMAEIHAKVGDEGKDQYLKLIAKRITKCLWDSDVAVHFDTNQFVIVANSIQRQEDIHVVMNKVRNYVALECEINNKKIKPCIAIGIVLLPTDTAEIDEIMTIATTAVDLAKTQNITDFYYYNQDLGIQIEAQETIKNSILTTLAQESFILMLQPKIDTANNHICGVEALVRMCDSDGEIVKPAEFIPVAENSNLILKVGDWVLSKAAELCEDWHSKGLDIPISVNISDIQFKNGAAMLSTLHRLSTEKDGFAKNIILEISENSITNDVALATALITEIKSYGFQISIDGFGSGSSNFSVLKELNVDEIKIDQCFLKDVPADDKSTAILQSLIILGKSMDFRVVAMGVEREEQLDTLKGLNCDEFQGFLISEPIIEEDFVPWLKHYSS